MHIKECGMTYVITNTFLPFVLIIIRLVGGQYIIWAVNIGVGGVGTLFGNRQVNFETSMYY